MVSKLEALADAIASLNEYHAPESRAYQIRNPGMLRAFTLRHPRTKDGYRIFEYAVDGYQALLYDLRQKCSGESRSKLKVDDNVESLLLRGYSQPPSAAEYVLCFLQNALPNKVAAGTPLKFFIEG